MPDLCIHELHRCADCDGIGEPARGPALPGGQRSRPFRARFAGTCRACGFDIAPGQMLRYEADGRLLHEGCADA